MGDNVKKKFILIVIISFLLDQMIKYTVEAKLTIINVIPNIFKLIYTKNEGVAFSLFDGKRIFIIIVSIAVIYLLFKILSKDYFMKKNTKLIEDLIYGILYGGIFGNLFDRIIRGYVVDYISLNIFGYNFPVFNLADIFITLSVVLIIIFTLMGDKNKIA